MMTTAPERFEDRLLHELRRIVHERPAPEVATARAPRRTRLALGSAGVAVAAATIVFAVVASSGDVTPSAYAVDSQPNGAVSVSIRSLSDAAGLQRSLRAAGVPAVVDYAGPGTTGCVPGATTSAPPAGSKPGQGLVTASGEAGPGLSANPSTTLAGAPGPGATTLQVAKAVDGGSVSFTIDPGTIKQGEKVYITTSTGAVGSIGMAIAANEPSPVCAPAAG